MAIDSIELSADFTADSFQGISAASTFHGGTYTDSVGVWALDGGSVLTIPITNGGSYTVAPTLTVATPTGLSTTRITATATANLVGGTIASITITRAGRGYRVAPTVTISGGTGSGLVLGTTTISGHSLQANYGGTTGNLGSGQNLLRPTGVAGQNQRIVQRIRWQNTTDKAASTLRYNVTNDAMFSLSYTQTTAQFWYFKNYFGTADATHIATNLGSLTGLAAPNIGDLIEIDFSATSTDSSTTSLTVIVRNITQGTTLGTKTISGLVQTDVQAPGQLGIGFNGNSAHQTESLITYNQPGVILASPTTMAAGGTYNIVLTGAGTTWLTTPPTLSGVPYTINSTTATSDTSYTFNVTLGGSAGTVTATDPNTGTFINIPVTGIVAPTITAGLINTSGATIAFGGGFTLGVAPYTVTVEQSRYSNQAHGDGNSTVISTQTGVGEGVTPTSVPYTGASAGGNFFRAYATDANGIVGQTFQTQCVVPLSYSGLTILGVGDSTCRGANDTVTNKATLYDRAVNAVIGNEGSGYTSTPTFTVSGGTGTKTLVVGGCYISGGAIKYVWFSDPGIYTDPANPPTITVSGGGGSGCTISSVSVGGGESCALERLIRSRFGMSTFRVVNCGVDGTQTANWLIQGATDPVTSILNPYYNLNRALAQAGSPSTCPIVLIRLGANDCNLSFKVSKANYKARLNAIVTYLVGLGYVVVLDRPMWRDITRSFTADEQSLLLLAQYSDAMDEIVTAFAASNPAMVYKCPTDNYLAFMENPAMLYDGLHCNDAGYAHLAASKADFIEALLRKIVKFNPFSSPVFGGTA